MPYQGWGGSAPDDNKNQPEASGYQGWGMAAKPIQPTQTQPQAQPALPSLEQNAPQDDGSAFGIPYLGTLGNFVKGMAQGIGKILGPKEVVSLAEPLSGVNSIDVPLLGKTTSYQEDTRQATADLLKNNPNASLGQKIESVAGQAAKPVIDIGSMLLGGPESEGAVSGLAKLFDSLKLGGKIGGAYGADQALQEGKGVGDVASETAKGVVTGVATAGVTHGVLGGFGKMFQGKEAPVIEGQAVDHSVSAFEQPAMAKTMADIRTQQSPTVSLKPEQINPSGKIMQDILPPSLKTSEAPATQPTNIDKVIKDSGFVDVTNTNKANLDALGGGKAAGKARYDFKTGRGEIVLPKNASEATKAHEFAHPLNYKLGEGEKFTTQLDQFTTGKTDQAPVALEKYVRDQAGKGIPEPQIQLALKDTAQKIQDEMKNIGGDQKNSSETFAHAVSHILTTEDAHQRAPILSDFVKTGIENVSTPMKATDISGNASPEVEKAMQPIPKEAPVSKTNPEKPANAAPEKIPESLMNSEHGANVYTELDTAAPGQRFYNENTTTPGNTMEVSGMKSSFPKWVSSDLRSSKLFAEVKDAMIKDEVPQSKPAQRLYAEVSAEIKQRAGYVEPAKEPVQVEKVQQTQEKTQTPITKAEPKQKINPEDVIKETKKTIQVKTPSSITSGGDVPRGEFTPPKNSDSINLDKLNTSDDVKSMIDAIAKNDKAETDFQRRGTIDNKQLEELSSMTGIKTKDILNAKPGAILNAENALAARKIMLNAAQDIHEAGAKLGMNPSAEEMSNFKSLVDKYRGIQASISGFRSEAGRLLQQFNVKASPEEYELLKSVATQIGDDPSAMGVANALKPENIWVQGIKAGVDLRTVMMFTSPGTLEVKALGDFQNSILALADKAGSELVRPFLPEKVSKFLGFSGVAKGETAAHIQGMKAAFGIANEDFRADMKNILGGKTIDETEFSHGKFANPLRDTLTKLGMKPDTATKTDNYLKYPYQTFSAITNYFSKINFTAELYSQALRHAQVTEGLSGKALEARTSELIKNPEAVPAMYKNIMEKTQRATLLEHNKLAEGMTKLRDSLPFGTGKIFAPAVKIAANTESGMIRLSPLGALRPLLGDMSNENFSKLSDANKAFAYTRALYGTGLSLGIANAVVNGKITGSNPPQGVPANSVRINGHWYNYMKLGPIGELISNTANIVHDYGQTVGKNGASSTGEFVGDIALHGIKSFTDQPMIAELSDFINAVGSASSISAQGLGYYSNKIVSSLVTGSVPNIIKTFAKAQDPVMRDTSTIGNALENSIPGLREKLPERIGTDGQPIPQEGSTIEKFFSPFPTQNVDDSKLASELKDSNFKLSNTSLTSISGVKLDQQSKASWEKAVGSARNKVLSAIVSSDGFDNLPQFAKDEVLQKASSQVKSLFDKAITDKMQPELLQRKVMTKPEQKAFNQQLQGNLAAVLADIGIK